MNYGIVKRHTKMSIFAFNSLTLYWRQSLSYSYLIKKNSRGHYIKFYA